MSSTFTNLAAQHTDDLLREAEQARGAGELRLRFSRAADDRALEELAQLDCARPPRGPHLVAEVEGALRAAISLTDGVVIADPFHRTAAMVELLRAHTTTVLSHERAVRRTPNSLLRRLAGRLNRSRQAASTSLARRCTS